MTRHYRSIFWDDEWALEKYQRWYKAYSSNSLKVLRKKIAPLLTRELILCSDGSHLELANWLRAGQHAGVLEITIHDFAGSLAPETLPELESFRRLGDRERLLNTATYVIWLDEPSEALWAKLGPKGRNHVRRATSLGLEGRHGVPMETLLSIFFELYTPLAARLGLAIPQRKVLEQMQRAGNLAIAFASCADWSSRVINVFYIARNVAYSLYSASDQELVSGAGQFSQWHAVQSLKAQGCTTYDLGGVRGCAEDDKIHSFKRALGGQFIDLGREFRAERPIWRLALKARTWKEAVNARN